MSSRAKIWLIAAGGLVVTQAAGSLLLQPQSFLLIALSDIIQFLLLLSGTIVFLPRVFAARGRRQLFWLLMTVGMGFWLAYQLLWNYFEVALRQDVPNPFVGDVVLFLHLVPMMAALALQPHLEHDERTAGLGSLDFALLLVWWLYLYLFAVIPWQYTQTNAVIYEHNLNALYLTEKMVLLAGLAVSWWRSQQPWRMIYAHWFGASLTYALSSYLANWAIERNLYYSGSLYDVPLVVSMASITGIGLLAPSPTEQRLTSRSSAHGVWVARLGMIAIFSLPVFAAWSVLDHSAPARIRTFRLVLTLGSMLVMGGLVFLRQHMLDRELVGLLRASQDSYENLERLQSQVLQSEKLASLGLLVGGAAHELNNPLTAMLGYSDLLAATDLKPEQHLLAEKIGQQVRRTKSLISSLLSFAKQSPGEKSLLDVNALAQTTIRLSQAQLRGAKLEIQTDLAATLPLVSGDSNQLLHVCLHIADNVLHPMRKSGGTLRVSTRRDGDFVVLELSGSGPGAHRAEPRSDPFGRARPIGHQTGLGMSACYGIIQEHQGKIVRQRRPASGETFRIELPVAATSDAGTAVSSRLQMATPEPS